MSPIRWLRNYHIRYGNPATVRILVNNRGVWLKLQDVQGYNPVQNSAYVEFVESTNTTGQSYHAANILASGLDSPLLNLLNVRYVVVPAYIPPGRPDLLHLVQRLPTVHVNANARILENPDALPRARIVHHAEQKSDREEILTAFSLKISDPASTALMTSEPPILDQPTPSGDESVEVVSYRLDEIHMKATAQSTGLVVVSEIWDPNWTATVDGQRTEVYQVDGLFRGIAVTPGTHEIVLRDQATVARVSLFFYLVPIAALAAIPLAAYWNVRKRRRPVL